MIKLSLRGFVGVFCLVVSPSVVLSQTPNPGGGGGGSGGGGEQIDDKCYRYTNEENSCATWGAGQSPPISFHSFNDQLCDDVPCNPHLNGTTFVWRCEDHTEVPPGSQDEELYHKKRVPATAQEWNRLRKKATSEFTGPGLKRASPTTNEPNFICFVYAPCEPGETCTNKGESWFCRMDHARAKYKTIPDYVLDVELTCVKHEN